MNRNKKRSTFKEIVAAVPHGEPLSLFTKLPYVFDLHWDAKDVLDLWIFGEAENPMVLRLLAEHGYDSLSLAATKPNDIYKAMQERAKQRK